MRARSILSVAITALTLAALPARAQDARAILSNSLEPRETTYTGEQATQESGGPRRTRPVQRQRVFRRGSELRIEYANGRVVYDNGKEQLLYLPRQKVVEHSPSRLTPQRVRQQRRLIRTGRLTVEQLPDETVAGRPAYVLSVKGPNAKASARKLWIDQQNFLQLGLEETRPNGRTIRTYFTRITFGQAPGTLALSLPADVSHVERGLRAPLPAARVAQLARAWGGLLKPGQLPPGYRLRGYYRHMFGKRAALVAVYDGPAAGATLSVFQGPAMGMGGMVERTPRLSVLSARKGSADVTLVGPLPEDELQKVMDSVGPAQ